VRSEQDSLGELPFLAEQFEVEEDAPEPAMDLLLQQVGRVRAFLVPLAVSMLMYDANLQCILLDRGSWLASFGVGAIATVGALLAPDNFGRGDACPGKV